MHFPVSFSPFFIPFQSFFSPPTCYLAIFLPNRKIYTPGVLSHENLQRLMYVCTFYLQCFFWRCGLKKWVYYNTLCLGYTLCTVPTAECAQSPQLNLHSPHSWMCAVPTAECAQSPQLNVHSPHSWITWAGEFWETSVKWRLPFIWAPPY